MGECIGNEKRDTSCPYRGFKKLGGYCRTCYKNPNPEMLSPKEREFYDAYMADRERMGHARGGFRAEAIPSEVGKLPKRVLSRTEIKYPTEDIEQGGFKVHLPIGDVIYYLVFTRTGKRAYQIESAFQ